MNIEGLRVWSIKQRPHQVVRIIALGTTQVQPNDLILNYLSPRTVQVLRAEEPMNDV